MYRPFPQVLILVAIAMAWTACGSEKASGPQDEATVTQPQSTRFGRATEPGSPLISGNLLTYPEKGYEVTIPDGWTAKPDYYAPFSEVTLWSDVFFAASLDQPPQPSIVVTCTLVDEGTELQAFFDSEMAALDAQLARNGNPERRTSQTQAADRPAYRAEYDRKFPPPPFDKVEVYFVNKGCGWSIHLTAPEGKRAEYEPILEGFIESFRLSS